MPHPCSRDMSKFFFFKKKAIITAGDGGLVGKKRKKKTMVREGVCRDGTLTLHSNSLSHRYDQTTLLPCIDRNIDKDYEMSSVFLKKS